MDYAEEKQPLDEIVEDKGVTIFIEAKAVLFLLGTKWIGKKTSCRPVSGSTIQTKPTHAAAVKVSP